LIRARLALDSLQLDEATAHELVDGAADPTETARELLASTSTTAHDDAIRRLVAACEHPAAATLLAETAQSHAVASARAAAAKAARDCHGDETVAALVAALSDAEAAVRMNAADSLGYLGASEARSALEQVYQNDTDADARGGARRALKKIGAL